MTTLPGVGQFTALVMLAEIGDITRFPSARKLASWAGLTPTVRGSDLHARHEHISKQGSAWLRWVLNQAAQTSGPGAPGRSPCSTYLAARLPSAYAPDGPRPHEASADEITPGGVAS